MSLSHAKTIEAILGEGRDPTSMHWAAEILGDYGSDQDPIEFWDSRNKTWLETTAVDLAYSQWRDDNPAKMKLKFYGDKGPTQGSVLAMIVDRIKLRHKNCNPRKTIREREAESQAKARNDAIDILEYVTEGHEWCDRPWDFDNPCKTCGTDKRFCDDYGKCGGCKMRKKALLVLKNLRSEAVK